MKSAFVAVLLTGALCATGHAAEKGPNVLFLFTDDQRHDTIHAWGNDKIHTPHIDRLVREGLSFRNTYIMGATSPAVCTPSRASLMTGRTLWNVECQGMWSCEISEKFKTLPEVFRDAGYETFATGKIDPGKAGQFGRAFSKADQFVFHARSHYRMRVYPFQKDGDYSDVKPSPVTEPHSAELYANATIKFLKEQKDAQQPFFAYVSFQTPHDPLEVPEEHLARYDGVDVPLWEPFMPEHPFDNGILKIRDEKLEKWPRTKEKISARLKKYYALMTHTDEQVGRILSTLDELGMTDNTIIVFASDNGLALGSHGLLGKQNLYEHSVKVPLIVSGPGLPKGEDRKHLAYLYDIYPTLCDLSGLKTPETVQYRSLQPVIADSNAAHRDHLYFAFMEWQRSVHDGRYKLIEYCVDGERTTQLFDLREDPDESRNLATSDEYQDKLLELRKLLEKERLRLNDGQGPYEFSRAQGEKFWATYDNQPES